MRVTVVIPVFNEEENIAPLAEALGAALKDCGERELIFVDDGSRDGSLALLRVLSGEDPRIRYISFSRNFGHQTALRAGIEAASGDCVVTMDGDFQHPPAFVPTLIAEYERGFDVVATRRLELRPSTARPSTAESGSPRRLPLGKRLSSRFFYAFVNALSDVRIEPGSADFRLLSKRARDALLSMKEQDLFLRGAVPWIGLPSTEIAYAPESRRSGKSKYSFSKMLALAMDGITSFSVKPLRLTSIAGLVISGAGFFYALYALVIRLCTDRTVEGWTSLLISILIIGGIQLISLGIIGEYLGKLFMEAKGRPHYIVKETSPGLTGEEKGGRS